MGRLDRRDVRARLGGCWRPWLALEAAGRGSLVIPLAEEAGRCQASLGPPAGYLCSARGLGQPALLAQGLRRPEAAGVRCSRRLHGDSTATPAVSTRSLAGHRRPDHLACGSWLARLRAAPCHPDHVIATEPREDPMRSDGAAPSPMHDGGPLRSETTDHRMVFGGRAPRVAGTSSPSISMTREMRRPAHAAR
jgi:hypothetical protein